MTLKRGDTVEIINDDYYNITTLGSRGTIIKVDSFTCRVGFYRLGEDKILDISHGYLHEYVIDSDHIIFIPPSDPPTIKNMVEHKIKEIYARSSHSFLRC